MCCLYFVGGNSVVNSGECSTLRKVTRRTVALGTVMVIFFWMVRLFALEVSSENVLNSSLSKY